MVGIVPTRTADHERARTLVAERGAAILTGVGPTEADAQEVARAVWRERTLAVPAPAAVREGGDQDRVKVERNARLDLHTDGFAYGDRAPDVMALVCVQDGSEGGESFLTDGYAVLEHMDRALRRFLTEVDVDQTEPGARPNVAPTVLRLASGRVAVRQPLYAVPVQTSSDPFEDAMFIDQWKQLTAELSGIVPRFRLEPGEALVVDNYRVLHGRDGYAGERFLWRVWAWTTEGNGVPAGPLHSDSRYAFTA
jgi:alpha-ketoglutarate-dependent taurine dioxygenase